eukprot:gnl/Chilomastix_cuspidata/5701.p1 GENE.gnl/Chilomastix_cuspidata/5701~~gnl/Chilomastix_cuspidata/5701.p1  ORF type:complete len:254 (+),score=16.88 gnl/Chilomastix_cuspidata/5701:112-762(+)
MCVDPTDYAMNLPTRRSRARPDPGGGRQRRRLLVRRAFFSDSKLTHFGMADPSLTELGRARREISAISETLVEDIERISSVLSSRLQKIEELDSGSAKSASLEQNFKRPLPVEPSMRADIHPPAPRNPPPSSHLALHSPAFTTTNLPSQRLGRLLSSPRPDYRACEGIIEHAISVLRDKYAERGPELARQKREREREHQQRLEWALAHEAARRAAK